MFPRRAPFFAFLATQMALRLSPGKPGFGSVACDCVYVNVW
jgi:hypothetical protein